MKRLLEGSFLLGCLLMLTGFNVDNAIVPKGEILSGGPPKDGIPAILKPQFVSPKEAEFLKYLIEHKNQVIKRERVLEDLWGENDYFLGRSMDVFMTRLRKYLKPDQSVSLDTIRGVGIILRTGLFPHLE